jgi:large subunit ribosomal protein L14
MVRLRSVLKVLDNSGVRYVRSFDIPGKRKGYGEIGDRVTTSVLSVRPSLDGSVVFSKGDVVHGILVTSLKGVRRGNGLSLEFPENGVVLLNKKGELVGQRVRGVLPRELRGRGHAKLLLIADGVV